MKKLVLIVTASMLAIAASQPSFAASRSERVVSAQAADQFDQVRRDYYRVYGTPGYDAFARGESRSYQVAPVAPVQSYPSGNLPYPDRPWGAPDRD